MAVARVLNNPPIVEAIFDIKVSPPVDLRLDAVVAKFEPFGFEPARAEEISELEFTVRAGPRTTSHEIGNAAAVGYRLFSNDRKDVLQIRRDGFTYTRLAPYVGWEKFFADASSCWKTYRENTTPQAISRIALRYINRIDLVRPAGSKRLGQIFEAPLRLPQGYPRFVSQWMTRMMVHEPDQNLQGFVTIISEPPKAQKSQLILDLDVFSKAPLPVDYDALLSKFLLLRDMKNRLFFATFKEAGLDLFQ